MTIPTLVLHGDADRIVPIAVSALLSAKIAPRATLKIVPGEPHGTCTTMADTIDANLVAFFRS